MLFHCPFCHFPQVLQEGISIHLAMAIRQLQLVTDLLVEHPPAAVLSYC